MSARSIPTLDVSPLRRPIDSKTFVDERFKPVSSANTGPMEDLELTIDQRVALLELRIARVGSAGSPEKT